jgi:DNA-binding transcriptional MerR regulator
LSISPRSSAGRAAASMKKDYKKLKIEAIELRKKGLSYGEIRKKLNVAKSTLSYWLKSIPLTPEQRKRFYTKAVLALARGTQSQKERRKREIEKIIKEAEKEIQFPLSIETFRLIGAFLYWAEGSKTEDFAFSNSDPSLIAFMVKWLKEVLKISPETLKANLNIYPQQNEQEIKQFWSQLISIPLENFGKSYIKPLSRGYKKNNLYYGTIKIRVPKGTNLRYRVFGWIKAVLKNVSPEVEPVQKEWKFLKEKPRPVNIQDIEISCPRSSIGRAAHS